MAHPSSALSTLRPELSTFEELDLEMQRRGYVATEIMPSFQVGKASGTFSVIALKSLLANADADTKRTSTGGYNRGDYSFEERSFQTKENGWEEPVDSREKNMYSSFFDLEQVAALRAWEHVLNSLERRVIQAAVTDTVTAGQTTAAGAVWTNTSSATPIVDVNSASEAVWLRTGLWPDTLVLTRRAFRALRLTDDVINAVQAAGAGESAEQKKVTAAMLAEVFDVEKVVVADAIKNTANRGQAVSIGSVFPENQALLCKSASSNDFKEPCLGRTFHWGGDGSVVGGDQLMGVVERYREESSRKDIVRVRHETDEFILYPEMAQVVTGIR